MTVFTRQDYALVIRVWWRFWPLWLSAIIINRRFLDFAGGGQHHPRRRRESSVRSSAKPDNVYVASKAGKRNPAVGSDGVPVWQPSSGHHNRAGSNLPRSLGRCPAPPANRHGGSWRSGSP